MQRRNLTALLLLLVVVGVRRDGLRLLGPCRGGGRRAGKGRGDRGLRPEQGRPHGGRRQAHRPRDGRCRHVERRERRGRPRPGRGGPGCGRRPARARVAAGDGARDRSTSRGRPACSRCSGATGWSLRWWRRGIREGTLTYRARRRERVVHAGQRVRVEVELSGGGEQKTIPYSAVIYGVEGGIVDVHQRRPADVRSRADHGGVGPG